MWSLFHTRPKHLTRFALLMVVLISLGAALLTRAHVVSSIIREEVILLTAFEPFGGRPINASWEAVRQLNGTVINGHRVVAVRLPVVWATAWLPLQAAIDRYQPSLLISVGQGSTSRLELARSARNIYGKVVDNVGVKPTADVITLNGPAHYDTRLNLVAITERLALSGITANVAPHAGDFICNFVSYRSYEYLAQTFPNTATFFVHVPGVATVDTPADQRQLSQLTDALRLIVDSASLQMSDPVVS